ncbi:MAG: F0F1 ATP synthase subunit B' [Rhodobacteraceae bacterium]|nr:F0F1 ATP synthase subunit B' [Paracoccaceae bacterium]
MPQLDFSTFSNQIFWLVLTLVAIYMILTRIALPRIGGVLAERSGTIADDIAAAEDLRAKAAEAEADYERELANARAHAQRIINAAKADIQADLDDAIARADARIAARARESEQVISDIRANALDSVAEVAVDTASALVCALGGSADIETISAAVASRLKG